MALPVFMVMTRLLTLEKSAKLGLVGIFSLVLIDIAFDIVRTTYSLSQYLSMHTNYTAIWTILEPTIAVIVCALPYYKILITRGKSRVRSDESSIGTRVTGASSRRRPHSTSIPLEMEFGSTRRLPSRRASQSSDSGP